MCWKRGRRDQFPGDNCYYCRFLIVFWRRMWQVQYPFSTFTSVCKIQVKRSVIQISRKYKNIKKVSWHRIITNSMFGLFGFGFRFMHKFQAATFSFKLSSVWPLAASLPSSLTESPCSPGALFSFCSLSSCLFSQFSFLLASHLAFFSALFCFSSSVSSLLSFLSFCF